MAVATGGRIRTATARGSWPIVRPILVQVGLAAGIAFALALALGQSKPLFAPIFAVATMEMICARHHRTAVTLVFGATVGFLIGASFNPSWPTGDALVDAGIGAAAAIVVAVLTTSSRPVAEVHRAIDPLLGLVAGQVRAVATALRTGDVDSGRAAVRTLNTTSDGMRKLDETVLQVRRSAVLARWRSGQDLPAATTTATEIGYAVRAIRSMALQAWWGVLRGRESVPAALPQMLDALADGIAVMRGELAAGGDLRDARRLLISSAQWLAVLRTDKLGIAAAAVAANADAAVLNLLIATGLSLEAADASMRRPPSL